MLRAIFNAFAEKFGERTATKIMIVVIVLNVIGVITSFYASFFMGAFAMMTVITPIVIGLTTVITFGHVNLAAVIDHWLFATQAGAVTGGILAAIFFGIFLFKGPDLLNEWIKNKTTIK